MFVSADKQQRLILQSDEAVHRDASEKKSKSLQNNFKLTLDDLEAQSSQKQKAFPLFDVSRNCIQHSSADFCKARDRRDNESSRQRKLKRLLNRQKSRKFCEYRHASRNKLELKKFMNF